METKVDPYQQEWLAAQSVGRRRTRRVALANLIFGLFLVTGMGTAGLLMYLTAPDPDAGPLSRRDIRGHAVAVALPLSIFTTIGWLVRRRLSPPS